MTQGRACPDCHGQGIEQVYGGHGTVIETPCPTCRGSGLAPCDEPPKGEDTIAAEGRSPASAVGKSRGAHE